LDDVARAGAAEIAFVRHPRGTAADDYLDDLEQRASSADFVTTRLEVNADCAFDELAALVAAIMRDVRAPASGTNIRRRAAASPIPIPGARARRGFTALLDAFIARRGHPNALADFDERLEAAGLGGDVATLARGYLAYLESPASARSEE